MKIEKTIIGFAFALAACGNEGLDFSEQNLRAVGFGSYTEQFTTRGEVKGAIPDSTSIGIYAYYHDDSNWAADAAASRITPNFMWNQQAAFYLKINAFVYSPLKYWPNEETDKLSFIAYYPFTDPDVLEDPGSPEYPEYPESTDSTGLTPLLHNDDNGLPSFNFTVKDTQKYQTDLLVSELITNLPQTRDTESDPGLPFNDLTIYDKVKFRFHHALSKIEFRVVADAEIRKDIVSFHLYDLGISNIYKDGTLTTAYDALEGTSYTWSGQTNRHGTNPAYNYPCTTYVPYLLMPQTLRADAMLSLDYEITLKSDGTTYHYVGTTPVADQDYTYRNTASIQLNTMKLTGSGDALTEWLPNHHYIYTIRLRANRIEFTGEVVDWGEELTPPALELSEE